MKTKNLTLTEALATGLPFRMQETDYSWLTEKDAKEEKVVLFLCDAVQPVWEVKIDLEVKPVPREIDLVWDAEQQCLYPANQCFVYGLSDGDKVKFREVIE